MTSDIKQSAIVPYGPEEAFHCCVLIAPIASMFRDRIPVGANFSGGIERVLGFSRILSVST